MNIKLLTEHHLECQSLKGGYTCQNAALLEITCRGSIMSFRKALKRFAFQDIILTLVLLSLDTSSLKNSVVPDQLISDGAICSGSSLFSRQLQNPLYQLKSPKRITVKPVLSGHSIIDKAKA